MKTATVLAAFLATASLHAAVIRQVIVRQQWPWSTDIKVEYKLAEVTNAVDISVKAFNGDVELDNSKLAESITGDLYGISESGIGQFIIDPVKAFGNAKVAIADFRVELEVTDSATNINEPLYKILCLTNGVIENVTRADLLNGRYGSIETDYSKLGSGFTTQLSDVLIWTGVTNDVKYKSTHMVLRKIPAKDRSFKFQKGNSSVNGGAGVDVLFTNDFYIGVFEVTQAQFANTTAHPYGGSNETNAQYAAYRPVNRVPFGKNYYTSLRGYSSGRIWPEGDHVTVDASSYFGKLQASTKVVLDLPTEAMWEFACRAMSANDDLYTGNASSDAQASLIMRAFHINCVNEGVTTPKLNAPTAPPNCDLTDGPAWVGSYMPNAWGLYDMLGNIWEFCLDRYGPIGTDALVDPRGPAEYSTANMRVLRGGAYNIARNACLCYARDTLSDVDAYRQVGFRVCLYPDAEVSE